MSSQVLRQLLLPIVFAAMLAGCTLPSILSNQSAQVVGAQGDTTIDLAYNVAATAYLKALPSMSASTKATLKPLLVKAYSYVSAADAADALGQSTSAATDIAQATSLINQVKSALGVN